MVFSMKNIVMIFKIKEYVELEVIRTNIILVFFIEVQKVPQIIRNDATELTVLGRI